MESAAQCFQYTRMPKVLQTTNPDADYDTSATAIAVHDASNAIFVGGHIIEENFLIDLAVHGTNNIGTAHVGRISSLDSMWYWSK